MGIHKMNQEHMIQSFHHSRHLVQLPILLYALTWNMSTYSVDQGWYVGESINEPVENIMERYMREVQDRSGRVAERTREREVRYGGSNARLTRGTSVVTWRGLVHERY